MPAYSQDFSSLGLKEIILYLRKGDRAKYVKVRHNMLEDNGRGLDYLLEESETNTFELFQILMFMSLDDPEDKFIRTFIENRSVEVPAAFYKD